MSAEESRKIQDSLKQIPSKEEMSLMKEQLQTQVNSLAEELRSLKKVCTTLFCVYVE